MVQRFSPGEEAGPNEKELHHAAQINWFYLEHSREMFGASQLAQWQRTHLPTQEMQVRSLGWKEALENKMATHSSILASEIPWAEEPGELQSMGPERVGQNLATKHHQQGRSSCLRTLSKTMRILVANK